jgi:hypothetical protein
MGRAMLSNPSTCVALMPISLCMGVRLRQDQRDVEGLEAEVRRLVGERQGLREEGAARAELERNRSRIVRTQLDLAQALIRRHM